MMDNLRPRKLIIMNWNDNIKSQLIPKDKLPWLIKSSLVVLYVFLMTMKMIIWLSYVKFAKTALIKSVTAAALTTKYLRTIGYAIIVQYLDMIKLVKLFVHYVARKEGWWDLLIWYIPQTSLIVHWKIILLKHLKKLKKIKLTNL